MRVVELARVSVFNEQVRSFVPVVRHQLSEQRLTARASRRSAPFVAGRRVIVEGPPGCASSGCAAAPHCRLQLRYRFALRFQWGRALRVDLARR